MMRVEVARFGTGREMAGIFRGYSDNAIDLADGMLEEMEQPAKLAVSDARDLWFADMLRLLALRTTGVSIPERPPVHRGGGDRWSPESLLDSFRKLAARIRGRVASAGFKSNHPGANRVEFGFVDRDGHRTFPHPYVRTSYENTREAMLRRLEQL